MRFPLKKSVVAVGAGEVYEDPLTGRLIERPGQPRDVKVFGWSVVRSEEIASGVVAFLDERLQIIGPPGVLTYEDKITLPDGTVWALQGNEEDHNNNPWWEPGLVIYTAQKSN